MGGGGGFPDQKHGNYIGPWGALGSPAQKGVTTYAISPNRQRPLAGAFNAAIFNTWRRFRSQVLYVVPPFLIAYSAMRWAIEKNEFFNSKEGRVEEEE